MLWPYLLECVVPEQYTDGMGSLCRAIATITNRKREDKADDFEIDYEQEGIGNFTMLDLGKQTFVCSGLSQSVVKRLVPLNARIVKQ